MTICTCSSNLTGTLYKFQSIDSCCPLRDDQSKCLVELILWTCFHLDQPNVNFVVYSRTLVLRNIFRDVECKVYINYTCKSTSHKNIQAMNQFSCLRIFHMSNYLHVIVVYDEYVAQKMMLKFCHIIWRYLKLLKLSGCATNWLVELPKHLAGIQLYKVLISIGQPRFL